MLLKQGTVYASIGITDDVSNPIGVFTRIDTRTQSQGTLFYIRVLLYSPDWDSLSDMYIDWSVTGGKASNFNKTSGRITNFQWFNGGADWANYAVGYEPIYISQSSSTGATTTTNIVANGLVFDSGIQTRDVIIGINMNAKINVKKLPKEEVKLEDTAPPKEENLPEYVTVDENGLLIVDNELKEKIKSQHKCI